MNKSNLTIPVTLTIQDLARGGAGVSRDAQGRITFVPFTAPGDVVRVRITKEEKSYAQAELVEVLEPSPLRQVPRCPAFGVCGGCDWQHIPYELQWKTKSDGVIQALKRAGVNAPQNIDLIPAEVIWEYRNRVQLRGLGEDLGFFRAGSKELVPVHRCDLARKEINESWEKIRKEGSELPKQEPYKVEVEVAATGSGPTSSKVTRTWNDRHSALGFRQVHDEQNEKLKAWVGAALPDSPALYDLFGGAGNLSLPLAGRMGEVHCVDLGAANEGTSPVPKNFYFHRSSVQKWLRTARPGNQVSITGKTAKGNAAIIDPPREGLGGLFQDIARSVEGLGVRHLVTVGCDADTWSKETAKWIQRGWVLEKMMILDLFPQTHHVECAGSFRK